MTETAAKAYVNKEFGFEFSQIRIIDRIKDQVMRGQYIVLLIGTISDLMLRVGIGNVLMAN